MEITSFIFILFILGTVGLYYIIPKKSQWVFLLLCSSFFLFYKNFSWTILLCVLLVLLTAYLGGLLIEKVRKKKTTIFLIVLIILSQLIVLKYTNLFGTSLEVIITMLKGTFSWENVHYLAPLGVSYYTLIMIGYVVDVYRGAVKAQKNIFKCALFMIYFPQLVSGPITRYETMEKELYKKHRFNYDTFVKALVRILWGFFKILVISVRLGTIVDEIYGNMSIYQGLYIWFAAGAYTLQLYTNFSGSIDIIMGISECFGITLPENFNTPFFAKSITEFWRRWHISLGNWLKDYIFYPLMKSSFIQNMIIKLKKVFGKKAGKKIPLYLAMLILWLCIGIWHGGAYNFIVASGLFQFLYIVGEDLLSPIADKINKKLHINSDTFGYKFYQCIRTFILFSFSMIFFRASSCSQAIEIIKNGFTIFNPQILLGDNLFNVGLIFADYKVLILALCVLFTVELNDRKRSVRDKLFEQNLVFRWLLLILLLFFVVIFGSYGPGYDSATFIYRQF